LTVVYGYGGLVNSSGVGRTAIEQGISSFVGSSAGGKKKAQLNQSGAGSGQFSQQRGPTNVGGHLDPNIAPGLFAQNDLIARDYSLTRSSMPRAAVLDFMRNAMASSNRGFDVAESRLQSARGRTAQGYAGARGEVDKIEAAGRRGIADRALQDQGRVSSSMASRGLTATSALDAARRGSASDTERRYQDLEANLAGFRGELAIGEAGADAGLLGGLAQLGLDRGSAEAGLYGAYLAALVDPTAGVNAKTTPTRMQDFLASSQGFGQIAGGAAQLAAAGAAYTGGGKGAAGLAGGGGSGGP
jgi:hypothetical protein